MRIAMVLVVLASGCEESAGPKPYVYGPYPPTTFSGGTPMADAPPYSNWWCTGIDGWKCDRKLADCEYRRAKVMNPGTQPPVECRPHEAVACLTLHEVLTKRDSVVCTISLVTCNEYRDRTINADWTLVKDCHPESSPEIVKVEPVVSPTLALKPATRNPPPTTVNPSEGNPRRETATLAGFLEVMRKAMIKVADELCACTSPQCAQKIIAEAGVRGSDAGYAYTRGRNVPVELTKLLAVNDDGDALAAEMNRAFGASWFADYEARTVACAQRIIAADKAR